MQLALASLDSHFRIRLPCGDGENDLRKDAEVAMYERPGRDSPIVQPRAEEMQGATKVAAYMMVVYSAMTSLLYGYSTATTGFLGRRISLPRMAKRDEAEYEGTTHFTQPIRKRTQRSNLPFVSITPLTLLHVESRPLDICTR